MKLKNCPWCKKTPKIPHMQMYQVICANPFCKVQPQTHLFATKREAVLAWNTRPKG